MSDCPGVAAASLLAGRYRLAAYDELGSTNDEAKRLAAGGEVAELLVWARAQTGGRGRQGRSWESPPGNLYCSFLLRPGCRLGLAPQIGFAAVLAVRDVVAAQLPTRQPVEIKWPNDVLVAGRKVAGILLESHSAPDGALAWLVVGQGINLVSHPGETLFPASNLSEAGALAGLEPEELLLPLCERFSHWFDIWATSGFAPLHQAWMTCAYGLGEEIVLRGFPGREADSGVQGRFVALDDDGALVLEKRDGTRSRVTAGDVQLVGCA